MRRALRAALAAAFLLVPAGSLAGQEIPSPYRYIEYGQEAGPVVSWLDADRGRFGAGPEPGVMYGGRYGVWISGPFSIEGAVGVLPTTRDVVNPGEAGEEPTVIDGPGGPAEVTLLQVDARLQFNLVGRRTWNGLSPFLTAGGGVLADLRGLQEEDLRIEEEDRFDQGTGIVGLFGAGTRVFLGDRFTLRGDVLYTLHKLDIPAGFEDQEEMQLGQDEWVNSPTFSVALTYRW